MVCGSGKVIGVVGVLLGCWLGGVSGGAEKTTGGREARIIIGQEVVSSEVMGVGWNFDPQWIPKPRLETGMKELDEYFRLFREAEVPWIRLVLYRYEWEYRAVNANEIKYENDDADPWTAAAVIFGEEAPGFAWGNARKLGWEMTYVLDWCEKHDIRVEVNNWDVHLKQWLNRERGMDGQVSWAEAEKKAQEFGENFAALLYYLKTRANYGQGYECVKYYALWNEAGGGYPGQDFISFDFPGYANLLHKAVYEHLQFYDRQMGTEVTGQLRCIGLESFPFYRNSPLSGHGGESWPLMLGAGVLHYREKADGRPGEITSWPSGDPYMDLLSIHLYWSVFDYDEHNPSGENKGPIRGHLVPTVEESLRQIAKYDIDGHIEPLVIGELGSKAYCADCDRDTGQASYDHMLCNVESFVRAFGLGIAGGSMWAWNMHKGYAAVSYPGCWWEVEPKGVVHAVNENYYPLTLLIRAAKRGSSVLKTAVEGGADDSKGAETWPIVAAQRIWSTAFQGMDNKLRIIVVSDSYADYQIALDLTAFKETYREFEKTFVTSSSYDRFHQATVSCSANVMSDELAGRSVAVYVGSKK